MDLLKKSADLYREFWNAPGSSAMAGTREALESFIVNTFGHEGIRAVQAVKNERKVPPPTSPNAPRKMQRFVMPTLGKPKAQPDILARPTARKPVVPMPPRQERAQNPAPSQITSPTDGDGEGVVADEFTKLELAIMQTSEPNILVKEYSRAQILSACKQVKVPGAKGTMSDKTLANLLIEHLRSQVE